jgi:hypothetical protein
MIVRPTYFALALLAVLALAGCGGTTAHRAPAAHRALAQRLTALEVVAHLPDRGVQCGNIRLAEKRNTLSGYEKGWVKGYSEELEKQALTDEAPSGVNVFNALEGVCLRD